MPSPRCTPPTSGQVLLAGRPLALRLGIAACGRWLAVGLCTAMCFGLGADILGVWQAAIADHYVFQQPFAGGAAIADGLHELAASTVAHWAEAFGFVLGVGGAISAWRRSRLVPELVVRAGISRTFQNIRLFPALSVLDNVLVGMDAHLPADTAHAVAHSPRSSRRGMRVEKPRRSALRGCSRSVVTRAPAHQHRGELSPTGTSAAWRSRAPWPPGPSWSCSTSRPRG